LEVTVDIETLRKRKLFVATPMYGGMCNGMYTKSSVDLGKLCQAYEIEVKFFYLFNESLITRARNYCVDEFLRSDYSHLMFIDSDIAFDPNDVLSLLALSDPDEDEATRKEILCGPYPKKVISWEKIKRAVDKGYADENPGELEKFVGDFVFNPADGTSEIKLDEPVEVLEGGTGFMMIQKDTFKKFDVAYPEMSYIPDHIRTKSFDGSREIMAYFDALIDPESKRYLSEDYMFCQWMTKIDVPTWLCPWMKLSHCGSYVFGGSLPDLARLGASATADPEMIKNMKKN
tara:strand:+ start:150 stop:1013 length:864 start_codon:yes stop_codon:yes gene_type:complete